MAPTIPSKMSFPPAAVIRDSEPVQDPSLFANEGRAAGQPGSSKPESVPFRSTERATAVGLHLRPGRLLAKTREGKALTERGRLGEAVDDMASNLDPGNWEALLAALQDREVPTEELRNIPVDRKALLEVLKRADAPPEELFKLAGNREALLDMLEQEDVTPERLHGLVATAATVDKIRSLVAGGVSGTGFALGRGANYLVQYADNPWVRFGLVPGPIVAAAAVTGLSMLLPKIGPRHNPLVSGGAARFPNLAIASDHSADKALHYDPFNATFTPAFGALHAVCDVLNETGTVKVTPELRLAAEVIVNIACGAATRVKAYERSNSYRTDQGRNHRQAWLNAADIESTRKSIKELKRGVVPGMTDLMGESLQDVLNRTLPTIIATMKTPKTYGIAAALAVNVPWTMLGQASGVSDKFNKNVNTLARYGADSTLIPTFNLRFYFEKVAEKIMGINHQEVIKQSFGQITPKVRSEDSETDSMV